MHHTNPVFVGIDIAKDKFDLFIAGDNTHATLPNTPEGHADCVERLRDQSPTRIVLEATGGYERALMTALLKAGLNVVRINPKRVRDYIKSQGVQAKTDKIDARMLAEFAAQLKDAPRVLPDEKTLELQELVAREQDLTKMRTAETNRLQQAQSDAARKSIEKIIEALDEQSRKIAEQIDAMIDAHQPWADKAKLLQTACGIGPKNARAMVAHLPELGQCSRQQIASLVGLAPHPRDTGKRKGKRVIQAGRAVVRHLLFMATRAAVRFNPTLKKHYDHLIAKGKIEKVALVACMRKFLVKLNAMVRDNRPWQHTEKA